LVSTIKPLETGATFYKGNDMDSLHAEVIEDWASLQLAVPPGASAVLVRTSYNTAHIEIRGITPDPVRADTVKEAFAFFAGYRHARAVRP
jgi:hypothetical protein